MNFATLSSSLWFWEFVSIVSGRLGFPSFEGHQYNWLNNEEYEISKLGDLKSQIRNPRYQI
jgi:hypothetical protein